MKQPIKPKAERLGAKLVKYRGLLFLVYQNTGKENRCFWYIKTRGRKIAIENISLLYIPVH